MAVWMTAAGALAADPVERGPVPQDADRWPSDAIVRDLTPGQVTPPPEGPTPDVAATGSVEPAPTRGPDAVTVLAGLLQSRRYTILAERWPDVPVQARVEWARKAYGDGGSSVLGPLAIRDLWTEGGRTGLGPDDRLEAVRLLFYTYLRMRIDGELCSDASGPGDLLRNLRAEFRPVFSFAATLPPPVARGLALDAIALEQASAVAREADPYLCERGRLGLRSGRYLDRDTASGLVARTREAAGRDLAAFARAAP